MGLVSITLFTTIFYTRGFIPLSEVAAASTAQVL